MKNKALRRLISGLSLSLVSVTLFCFFPNAAFAQQDSSGFKLKTVVVDAGHGRMSNGTWRGASGDYSQESKVTLAVALKLRDSIQKEIPSLNVVMTRTTDDDVLWQKRADIANENKGQLFISLHCNSLSDRIVRGKNGKRIRVPDHSGKGVLLLVYVYRRVNEQEAAIRENEFEDKDYKENTELNPSDPASIILLNAFKDKYRKQSLQFANLVNDEFVNTDGRRSEGVREQSVLVLARSGMPAVLVEMGYINNPEEERYLNSEEGQAQIVATIVRALKEYKKEVEQTTAVGN
ncbi:N-acetylmuramoyl-L-alanine amidase [Mucilaginibacter yixingensis]|uniref:N-acetylmuramoyl-L-alanine amidase n=1 Tax=Mucilaginibacter yixingensis TaxID=1295612 RepID=A0A2T5J9S4_9SPHI|nr:N-acetylmuramoyl-L-alanine amidase [Mucilaginibacter yixingensis]PTQ96816.1 N-acetylmuramoyl-L-alanine amidase [Mucilaginibacter yixingensis]